MFAVIPKDQQGWIRALSAVEIPVLHQTVVQLAHLRENESRIVGRDISRVVLRDPMFILRVLRFLQERRRTRQSTEVTTVEHALMMMGISPFFRNFSDLPSVESKLADAPEALAGFLRVINRARRAALYARDWAGIRSDIESDEVVIAASLHDMTEMLLWCFAPPLALRLVQLQQQERTMRSGDAQKAVLGFKLTDLHLALISEWKLPALLQSLMHETQVRQPRALNVVLAVNLARHSANGWDDPALPDDYAAIGELLKMSNREVLERIELTEIQAEIERTRYQPEGAPEQTPPAG